MSDRIEITGEELALILEALQDAAFYRDTRAHVLQMAVRRGARKPQAVAGNSDGPAGVAGHRGKARAYEALAVRLRSKRV